MYTSNRYVYSDVTYVYYICSNVVSFKQYSLTRGSGPAGIQLSNGRKGPIGAFCPASMSKTGQERDDMS